MDNFLGAGLLLFTKRYAENANSNNYYFSKFPEEIQEAINQRADDFHSAEEIKSFADDLMLRS